VVGKNKLRGYCLEVIGADFVAGNLDGGTTRTTALEALMTNSIGLSEHSHRDGRNFCVARSKIGGIKSLKNCRNLGCL